jgi:UDP-N-acetyl-alpha-D-muramoyl-L-alanyl-L-glutamate epimerase
MATPVSFTFGGYEIDTVRAIVAFTYSVEFRGGRMKRYKDRLFFEGVTPEMWSMVPTEVLEPTLRALLLVIGINYWSVYPTRNMRIEGFALTREQARFWDALYLNGLGEFFYNMKIDFRDLIAFPCDASIQAPDPARFKRPYRTLLLNGSGKDSILSAEMLKESSTPFDFFAFEPTPAHERVASLVGTKTVRVRRNRDMRINIAAALSNVSGEYPSVSTFTFIAVLLAELLGYDSIVFSNERSADFGNLTYLGLSINHQWCKSSEAERMINNYIQRFITPDISTKSLLREYSELEIVRRFVRYPQYLHHATSCNTYFGLPWPLQSFSRTPYWCKRCPKCVFLFACFAAFLPKKEVVSMFGGNLYSRKRLIPVITRILGIEGFKPFDCVGEPEEMILAMRHAALSGDYAGEPAIRLFEQHFPTGYDFEALEQKVFSGQPPLTAGSGIVPA